LTKSTADGDIGAKLHQGFKADPKKSVKSSEVQ